MIRKAQEMFAAKVIDRKIALLAFAIVTGGLPGCAYVLAAEDLAPIEREPDYRRIISQNLELGKRSKAMKNLTLCSSPDSDSTGCSIFANPERLGEIQISGIRQVRHITKGWV